MLISCKDCGKRISSESKVCNNCGRPTKEFTTPLSNPLSKGPIKKTISNEKFYHCIHCGSEHSTEEEILTLRFKNECFYCGQLFKPHYDDFVTFQLSQSYNGRHPLNDRGRIRKDTRIDILNNDFNVELTECDECNQTILSTSKFCFHCGSSVLPSPSTLPKKYWYNNWYIKQHYPLFFLIILIGFSVFLYNTFFISN